jgi:hypothetical protein
MKLPEYDNRPAPGTPLYDDGRDSAWQDFKFPVLAIGLPILIVVLMLVFIDGLLDIVRGLFH